MGRKSITKNSRFFDFFGVEAIFQCKNQFFNEKLNFCSIFEYFSEFLDCGMGCGLRNAGGLPNERITE